MSAVFAATTPTNVIAGWTQDWDYDGKLSLVVDRFVMGEFDLSHEKNGDERYLKDSRS